MKIVIIGTGAREHAIAWQLAQHPGVELYNYGPTINPGITPLVRDTGYGETTDVVAVTQWVKERQIEIAWIGPEAPLAAGVVDALEGLGVSCVGPTQKLAQLESSKAFTRDLVAKYNIPGSSIYRVFKSTTGLVDFMRSLDDQIVVKPDGLTGGKGVRVMGAQLQDRAEAMVYCEELFAAGSSVVIEEKHVGQEFSLMSFSDGAHLVHMPVVQDHKRVGNGDVGSNTGGMGSYTDTNYSLPFLSDNDLLVAKQINEATLRAIERELGEEYKGIMYGGFMAVKNGVKLIEYNARFGDPEVMNLLSLLDTDLVTITQAILNRSLDQLTVQFKPQASVCKYVVPAGYPDDPVKNVPIDVSRVDLSKVNLFYGSIDQTEQGLIMKGSRAVAVVATGDTISAAEQLVEAAVQSIQGQVIHRSDIGTPGLIQQRIDMMHQLRHE